jgi:hypothetical protein
VVSKLRFETCGAAIACTAVAVLAASLTLLAGCGGSKPAYCTDRTNLQNAINGLTSLSPSSSVSALRTEAEKVQSAATALVNSAKSDFPSETNAIKASVATAASAISALPSSPSPAQIATIIPDAARILSSVNSFMNASKSKCS